MCVFLLHLVLPGKPQHLDSPSLGSSRSCKGMHAHVHPPTVKGTPIL